MGGRSRRSRPGELLARMGGALGAAGLWMEWSGSLAGPTKGRCVKRKWKLGTCKCVATVASCVLPSGSSSRQAGKQVTGRRYGTAAKVGYDR
jgi:hypothetical protein